MDQEYTSGRMVGSTTGSGSIMIWKALAFTFGAMGESMKVNTTMTRRAVMGYTTGQMGGSTKVGGTRESNMA